MPTRANLFYYTLPAPAVLYSLDHQQKRGLLLPFYTLDHLSEASLQDFHQSASLSTLPVPSQQWPQQLLDRYQYSQLKLYGVCTSLSSSVYVYSNLANKEFEQQHT